jgi:regulator of sirC expression with transglutaminase-like and TPR domain
MFHSARLIILAIVCACSSAALADVRSDVKAIFAQDMETIDLARAKLELDRLVMPSVDVDAELAQIDAMAAELAAMIPAGANAWAKVEVLRRYLFEAGPWNDNRPFAYDMADPYGKLPGNKLLADYLDDRQGNCITMPILMIVLGQRIGLDMTAASAPIHVLVKFRDDEGKLWNLEATSGGFPARDQHYRDLLPISDRAMETGIYLQPLTKAETVALMTEVVFEDQIGKGRYMDGMAIADIALDHYPLFVQAMVRRGSAAFLIIEQDFKAQYPTIEAVPEAERPRFDYLLRVNQTMFDKAEGLGWQPFNP